MQRIRKQSSVLFSTQPAETLRAFRCLPQSAEAREFQTPLRGSDLGYLFVIDVPIGFCWPDTQLDPAKLKLGLEKALDVFPIVASRIRWVNGRPTFTCHNSRGVLFQVEDLDDSMPAEQTPVSNWTRFFPPSAHFEHIHEPFNQRLMAARLTRFKNKGCILCVNFAHVLSDGAAILQFMKAWSYFCNDDPSAEPVPSTPVLERPLKEQDITASKQVKSKPRRNQPKTSSTNLFTVQAALVIMSGYHHKDDVADFALSAADFAKIKQLLSEKLEKPKWISSYEALMSLLLRALAIADGSADRKRTITARSIANIRGRSPLASREYFGNALSYPPFKFDSSRGIDLNETAFAFHESLRKALDDTEELNRSHIHAEKYARAKPMQTRWMLNRAGFAGPFLQSAVKREPIVNSWIGFDWFGMRFGSNDTPKFLKVSETFRHHRHIHAFPSNAQGDVTIRMNLSKKTMKKFRLALKELGFGEMFKEISPGTTADSTSMLSLTSSGGRVSEPVL